MNNYDNGLPARWDIETDVLVVGFGFAGGVAAVEAADSGAEVTIVEKMPNPGGISILAGGGIATAMDEEKAFEYLQHTNAGRTPDDVLRALAKGMTEMKDFVKDLVKETPFELEEQRNGGTYPFPGGDGLDGFKIAPMEGYQGFAWAKGLRGGARLSRCCWTTSTCGATSRCVWPRRPSVLSGIRNMASSGYWRSTRARRSPSEREKG